MTRAPFKQPLLLFAVLAVMVMFSACSKEEMVCPVDHTEQSGDAKSTSLSAGSSGTSTASGPSGYNSPTTNNPTAGDTRGISDDGDDLSDSEKGRKRRTN